MDTQENNHFGYIYTLMLTLADVTPPSDQLELMDMHMLDHQLVNFIQQVLENTDQSFYQNNMTESTNDFFSRPAYPQYATDSLGYPEITTITKLVGYTVVRMQNAQSKSSHTLPCMLPSLLFSAAFAMPRGQGHGHCLVTRSRVSSIILEVEPNPLSLDLSQKRQSSLYFSPILLST
jgi:hypothetical protein